MGMTIDKAIEYNKNLEMYMKISDEQEPYKFLEENYTALSMAIDTMRKYQQLQADYENRLKADMVAMLEDLRLRADETQGHKYNSDFWEGFYTYDDIIRAEINALKGETDDKRKTI